MNIETLEALKKESPRMLSDEAWQQILSLAIARQKDVHEKWIKPMEDAMEALGVGPKKGG